MTSIVRTNRAGKVVEYKAYLHAHRDVQGLKRDIRMKEA